MSAPSATPQDLDTWTVLVGRVSGHWDKANLKVKPFSTTPGRFAAGARFCAAVEGKRQLLEVRSSRPSGHSWILDCGLQTTAQAEALHRAELYIHPSMRPTLPEGEFYIDDLLGLRVQTEAGDDLGEIEEILETPAHDVYVTPLAMIPGHSEFVVSTDWENKILVVRDIPGIRIDDDA
jgi:16S rRNA processing protein RimM